MVPGRARERGILLLGNYPPPFGGVPTHVMYLADHLAERGWDVHVAPGNITELGNLRVRDGITVHRPFRSQRVRALLSSRLRVSGFPRQRKDHPTLGKYIGARATLSYLKGVILEHDVKLISAYHVFGAATLGAVLSRELGIPMITTIFGEIYSHTQLFRERLPEVEEIAARTSKWLSCSHHCARSMELLDLPAKVEALHYGIDTRHFHPGLDRTAVRRKLGIPSEDPVVIFVGRMKEDMGLGVLLQAIPLVIRRRPNVRFLVVGNVSALTKSTRWLARKLPGSVFVETDVPYAELPLHYAAADLAVAPSINARACLGLAIAEALATERPVVGCDVGGTREVLRDGMGRVVPPHDPFALAEAVVELLDDPRGIEEMGRRGRAHVLASFDKDSTNRRMEELIEEVLARAAQPGLVHA